MAVMGYGLLRCRGSEMSLIELGVENMRSIGDPMTRLSNIFSRVNELILNYGPDEAAIEEPFFGKNVQSMLKLGRAQGVCIAAALRHGLVMHQYSPRKIKQSIVGNGNAGKEQVAAMLERMLNFSAAEHKLDATDALAVAACHAMQRGNRITTTSARGNSWAAFVANNPDRIS